MGSAAVAKSKRSIQRLAVALFGGPIMRLVLLACAILILFISGEVAAFVLVEGLQIALPMVLVALLVITAGLLRGERFTRGSIMNVVPLIFSGLVSLAIVMCFWGTESKFALILAGALCVGASCVHVIVDSRQRLLACGFQILVLVFEMGGFAPFVIMAIDNNWL